MGYDAESWRLKAEGLVRQMDNIDKAYKKEIATLKEERDKYKEALELARGFLINKGYPETDPLVLGAINKALGLEEG